jgi:hypothetical protein
MPTIASASIPTPNSWDEFENVTLSAAKLRWESIDFFRNGRPGQKQDGVDIWGDDDAGRHIGVQCKNTVTGVSLEVVRAEISNAEAFTPALDKLYIAATARRDGPLQKAVRKLSLARSRSAKFKVGLLFWDDICQDLARDDDVFFGHYPQFKVGIDPARQHDLKLFDELTALLHSDGVVGFLDRTNMGGFSFSGCHLQPLHQFHAQWNAPERRFISAPLEEVRHALWLKAREYLMLLATESFPTHTMGIYTVPPEWEIEQPERFHRVVTTLHSLAGEIVTLHGELVRTGREHLLR